MNVKGGTPFIVRGLLFNVLTSTYLDVKATGNAPGSAQVVSFDGFTNSDNHAVRGITSLGVWYVGGSALEKGSQTYSSEVAFISKLEVTSTCYSGPTGISTVKNAINSVNTPGTAGS